jgi:hypothetical protein
MFRFHGRPVRACRSRNTAISCSARPDFLCGIATFDSLPARQTKLGRVIRTLSEGVVDVSMPVDLCRAEEIHIHAFHLQSIAKDLRHRDYHIASLSQFSIYLR